jgi:hypothetical protein
MNMTIKMLAGNALMYGESIHGGRKQKQAEALGKELIALRKDKTPSEKLAKDPEGFLKDVGRDEMAEAEKIRKMRWSERKEIGKMEEAEKESYALNKGREKARQSFFMVETQGGFADGVKNNPAYRKAVAEVLGIEEGRLDDLVKHLERTDEKAKKPPSKNSIIRLAGKGMEQLDKFSPLHVKAEKIDRYLKEGITRDLKETWKDLETDANAGDSLKIFYNRYLQEARKANVPEWYEYLSMRNFDSKNPTHTEAIKSFLSTLKKAGSRFEVDQPGFMAFIDKHRGEIKPQSKLSDVYADYLRSLLTK